MYRALYRASYAGGCIRFRFGSSMIANFWWTGYKLLTILTGVPMAGKVTSSRQALLFCPTMLHHVSCLKPHPEAETAVGIIWAGAAAAVTAPVHSGKSGGGTRCWVCSRQGQVRLSTTCD